MKECLICCEVMVIGAIGSCDHPDVCWLCTLKRRELYMEKDCIICKTDQKLVIFTANHTKNFAEFDLNKLIWNKKYNIYCETEEQEQKILDCWSFKCPQCTEKISDLPQLKKHIKLNHNLVFCELCLKFRKCFIYEQAYMDPGQVAAHIAKGSKELQIDLHPACQFCNINYFNNDVLFEHLHHQHYTCFLCEKIGVQFQYYKNYPGLEKHFRKDHFMCAEPDCLERRFVAFATAVEFQMHDVEAHLQNRKLSRGAEIKARQIDVSFNVLRANRHGEGIRYFHEDPSEPEYVRRSHRGAASADNFAPVAENSEHRSRNKHSLQQGAVDEQKKEQEDRAKKEREISDQEQDQKRKNLTAEIQRKKLEAATSPDDVTKKEKARIKAELKRKKKELFPTPPQDDFYYEAPPKPEPTAEEKEAAMKERNRQLIIHIKDTLQTDDKFQEFKLRSGEYRLNKIGAREYYSHFCKLFPKNRWNEIFLELVALLPDVKKQEELLHLQQEDQNMASSFPRLEAPATAPSAEAKAPTASEQKKAPTASEQKKAPTASEQKKEPTASKAKKAGKSEKTAWGDGNKPENKVTVKPAHLIPDPISSVSHEEEEVIDGFQFPALPSAPKTIPKFNSVIFGKSPNPKNLTLENFPSLAGSPNPNPNPPNPPPPLQREVIHSTNPPKTWAPKQAARQPRKQNKKQVLLHFG